MSGQRYHTPLALGRMKVNKCPECGAPAELHLDDLRFWVTRGCDLTRIGVEDRIEQYRQDAAEVS